MDYVVLKDVCRKHSLPKVDGGGDLPANMEVVTLTLAAVAGISADDKNI